MCEPVSLIGGVLSAAGQAAGQSAQANAQYQANKAARQQKINEQRLKMALDNNQYRARQTDRKRADREAGRAANEAYLGNQVKYNEKVSAFMKNKENRLIKSMTDAGVVGAMGQRGGSVNAGKVAILAAEGRDSATGLASLRSAATSLITNNRDIQGKLQAEYESNFSQVGDAPIPGFNPPPAVKPAGPSPLSIAANIGNAVVGSIGQGQAANTLPNGATMASMGGGNYSGFTGVNTAFNMPQTGTLFGFNGI